MLEVCEGSWSRCCSIRNTKCRTFVPTTCFLVPADIDFARSHSVSLAHVARLDNIADAVSSAVRPISSDHSRRRAGKIACAVLLPRTAGSSPLRPPLAIARLINFRRACSRPTLMRRRTPRGLTSRTTTRRLSSRRCIARKLFGLLVSKVAAYFACNVVPFRTQYPGCLVLEGNESSAGKSAAMRQIGYTRK